MRPFKFSGVLDEGVADADPHYVTAGAFDENTHWINEGAHINVYGPYFERRSQGESLVRQEIRSAR